MLLPLADEFKLIFFKVTLKFTVSVIIITVVNIIITIIMTMSLYQTYFFLTDAKHCNHTHLISYIINILFMLRLLVMMSRTVNVK